MSRRFSVFLLMCVYSLLFLLFLRPAFSPAQTILPGDARQWFKADLHTHHTYAEPVENIIRRYRETGYQFLVLSMKDDSKPLSAEKYSTPETLIIPGVEQAFITRKKMLGHIIAFPVRTPYPITTSWTLKEGYAKMRAKNKNVILGVNHPHDQRWTLDDALEADREGVHIFELNSIDMKHGEFETALWDAALTAGARFYATLVNDVHQFSDIDDYGYILIRADSLKTEAILDAIRAGDFYAVESGCKAKPQRYELKSADGKSTLEISAPGAKTIRIISDGGKIIGSFESESASTQVPKTAIYIRAEITDADGRSIFLQPFFTKN